MNFSYNHSHVLFLLSLFLFAGCKFQKSADNIVKPKPFSGPKRFSPGDIPNFVLLDQSGKSHELYRNFDSKAVVIVSHGNGCPIIQKNIQILETLKKKFEPQGVKFFLLNSNLQDSRSDIAKEAGEFGATIPVLIDPSQVIAKILKFNRTSEAVVLDTKTWKIIYRGAITDKFGYGSQKNEKINQYLSESLEQFLNNETILHPVTENLGCAITFRQNPDISYAKTIAPIINQKCMSCHSIGGLFPPYFKNYQSLIGWKSMIKETLINGRMPPWRLDPHIGKFKNDNSLTPIELDQLITWIDQGAPNTDKKDPLENFQPKKQIPKDPLLHTGDMKEEFVSPPEGLISYKQFQLGEAIPENMWITAIRSKSTNTKAMHHQRLVITHKPLSFYKEEIAMSEKEISDDDSTPKNHFYNMVSNRKGAKSKKESYFAGINVFAGGKSDLIEMPEGTAIFVPKGHYLILESHYIPTGKAEIEKTTIQFYGVKNPSNLKIVRSRKYMARHISIPPNTKDVVVASEGTTVKHDYYLFSFIAHMHLRGTAIKLEATWKNGKTETLMSIPNYYPDWDVGTDLNLVSPIKIPAGTILKVTCTYDNSNANPFNPDPNIKVGWGQTAETSEMCSVAVNGYRNKEKQQQAEL